jgi:hypothetical protein
MGNVKKFLFLFGRIKNFSDQSENLDSTLCPPMEGAGAGSFFSSTFFAAKENGHLDFSVKKN